MWYTKKKEILEHLGKNGRDVKGLDRLIKKGVVIEKNGSYIYRGDLDIQRIKKLKEQLKEKEKSEGIESLKSDLEYQISENERLVAEYEKQIKEITDRCYDYMSRRGCLPVDNMAQFKYWIKGEDYRDIQFSHEELSSNFPSNFSSNDDIELPF